MKSWLQKGCRIGALVVLGVLSMAAGAAMNREDDIQKYSEIFLEKPRVQQQQAAESLEWAGLSDPRVFDIVEKNLLDTYQSGDNKDNANYMAWLCKALAFSGQEKYRPTLEKIAKGTTQRNLRKYAEWSLATLATYTRWNPIISDAAGANPQKSAELNRFANMLRSSEMDLQSLAAQRVIEQRIDDEWLLDLVQQTVQPKLARDWSEINEVKAVAYMLKALASSGKSQYRATVEQAAVSAGSKKVRKYAEGYLKQY